MSKKAPSKSPLRPPLKKGGSMERTSKKRESFERAFKKGGSVPRTEKTSQLLQEALARLIQLEVRDPRLPKLVTLSHVIVSPDLSHAKIYFTILEGAKEGKQAAHILNHAAGYLRAQLPRMIQLRIVPRLHFIYDEALEESNRLSNLISQLPEELEGSEDSEKDE
jgi:ribosome-binding factor A